MSRKSEQCEQCADEPVGGSRSLDLPLLTVADVAELLNVNPEATPEFCSNVARISRVAAESHQDAPAATD